MSTLVGQSHRTKQNQLSIELEEFAPHTNVIKHHIMTMSIWKKNN